MAKMRVVGIDSTLRILGGMDEKTSEAVGSALYEGAKVIADAVRQEIESIPTTGTFGVEKKKASGLLPIQKEGLLDSLGIAKAMKKGDCVDVRIGFDGYNDYDTKKYTMGQPNAMIARSLESGTSFRNKNPFFSRAIRKSQGTAIETAQKILNEKIKL